MTFDKLTETVLRSSAQDWVKALHPLGLHILEEYSKDTETHWLRSFGVDEVATFREDISIQMADFTGPGDDHPFHEAWLDNFADKQAHRRWVHLLWNGHTVFRQFVLSVDGGRCTLPIPNPRTLDVPEGLSAFVNLFHDVFGANSSYGEYFRSAGFRIIPGSWPNLPATTR
jgi:hypothetical protein